MAACGLVVDGIATSQSWKWVDCPRCLKKRPEKKRAR